MKMFAVAKTWIIKAIRALANRLRPSQPAATIPLSEPSHPGTGPEPPIENGNLGHGDRSSRGTTGPIDDENGITEPSNTPEVGPENTVETTSLANDDPGTQSTGGPERHPERDDPEPPKSGREPPNIPGKRNSGSSNQPSKRPSSLPSSRPELICRKSRASTTWEIILTSTDEECQLTAVHLEGRHLDHNAHECHVPSLTGSLTASCQDKKEHKIPLFEGAPLIFKLRKNWSGEGRKTAKIRNGHFIVIAPVKWERTGRVRVEPEGCADTEFLAHYFYRDATATDESVGGFRGWSGSLVPTGIELTGQRVFDDSDEGDLFVGNAPTLKFLPEIKQARVGEEAKAGWAQNFLPNEKSLPEVLGHREGHFFLRVYDSRVMLDSMEFRYLSKLGKIIVNGAQYTQDTVLLPKSTGHPPTEVRFVGADDEMISPEVLEVPPNPDKDRISYSFGSGTGDVKIILDLPRIWWRLEGGQSDSGEWRDTLIVMTRQEFQQCADSATLWLLSRRFKSVRAGFDDEVTRSYTRTMDKDHIEVPLVHFVDYVQINQRLNDDVHFNIKWAGKIVPLIMISADPMPKVLSFTAEPATIFAGQETIVEWTTRDAGDARVTIDPDIGVVDSGGRFTVRPADTTRYTLTLRVPGTNDINSTVTVTVEQVGKLGERLAARVMSTGGGWRDGKGFSFRELQNASLTVAEAIDQSIPIDRRRRTSHRANTEKIRSMLDV